MADLNEGTVPIITPQENKEEKGSENVTNTIEDDPKTEEAKDKQQENDDDKSIYVKNVDYSTDQKELEAHFAQCGKIEKVTIVCDKYSGKPLGYAYMKFADLESAKKAIETLNDSLFKGRQITVMSKRKNVPFRGKFSRRFSRRPSRFRYRPRYR